MRTVAAGVSTLFLVCLAGLDAQQIGVQRFDQQRPAGARSPRNANYDIVVTLDHAARTISGSETIRWRNISANATSELQFHLYWNAWRNLDSTWLRERQLAGNFTPPRNDAWGSIDVTRLRVRRAAIPNGIDAAAEGAAAGVEAVAASTGPAAGPEGEWIDLTSQQRFLAPDDGNTADRTVMGVSLPFSVGPQETVEVDVAWIGKIPRPFARTGYVDDYYFIAQWFPKLGVLEDSGWNTHQFHAATEFFSDYGVYDVRINAPVRFVVGATGCRASVVPDPPMPCNGADTRVPPDFRGSHELHRFRAEDVHDFAWTASPHFIDVEQVFQQPGLPPVEMRLLLQPEHAGQEARHFDATAAALRFYGEWFGPYPYNYITIVDPAFQSGSGGMEYPTLFTAGSRWLAPARIPQPERVTIHEAGHQFWYGIVGTNEFEHAWMDEGLNTFSEARTMEAARIPNYLGLRFFGGFIPWIVGDIQLSRATDGNRLSGYRDNAEADAQSSPTFRFWPGTATFITYNKTALWLHTLERHLGWPVLQRAMSTFFERWQFRHPRPEDFFAVVNEVSGRDMTWFFDEVYRGSNVFDYGVQTFMSTRVRLKPDTTYESTGEPGKPDATNEAASDRSGAKPTSNEADGYRTIVVVRRLGEAVFPIDVVTTFRGGERVTERWDGRDRRVVYMYDRPAQALSVEVDPERVLLLDVNYTNNSATLEPRAAEASLKWSLKWLIWLQELMLTYAFFV